MEHKIFLGKYRVAADEIALSGAEPAGSVAVTEQHQTAVTYRGDEIESGRDVAIEVIPGRSLQDRRARRARGGSACRPED